MSGRVRWVAVWLAGLALGATAGCRDGGGEGGEHRPRGGAPEVTQTFAGDYPIDVVCTTGMVADLVRRVGGEHVRVTALMGEGVDPHLYKPVPGDVRRLGEADLVFYSGLHLEGKMSDVFVRLARRKPTFAVTEYVPEEKVLETEEGAYDPHLWFDVSLWSEAVAVVRDVLAGFDPKHAGDYEKNAAAYREELAGLHAYAKEQIATIPKGRRVLVTAHDAFRYFGRAYDIEVKGIQGISTEAEASVAEVNALVNFIVERGIKAVFVETSVSDRNMRALLEGAARKGHKVEIGGTLYSDAMGKEGTPEGTYVGMVRHNVDTIVRALK